MGARQRAQKRPKKPSNTNSPGWKSQKKSSSSLQVSSPGPFTRAQGLQTWQDYSSPAHNGFSLGQEARNTERNDNWTLSSRLRDNKVSFVSAGCLQREEGLEEKEEEAPAETREFQSHQISTISTALPAEPIIRQSLLDNSLDAQVSRLDLVGASTDSELSSVQRRKISVCSVQSDEVIVFAGRSGLKTPADTASQRPTPSPRIPTPSSSTEKSADIESQTVSRLAQGDGQLTVETPAPTQPTPGVIRITGGKDKRIHRRKEEIEDGTAGSQPEFVLPSGSHLPQGGGLSVPENTTPKQPTSTTFRRSGGRDKRTSRRQQEIEEEETLMQDYIDNMIANDEEDDEEEDQDDRNDGEGVSKKTGRRTEHFRFHHGAGKENFKVKTTASGKMKERTELEMLVWDSDDLRDFDGLSTTDEEVEEINQVLRERRRPTGMQYLVTAVGKSIGDAQWVSEQKMKSDSAREELRIWRDIRTIERDEDEDDSDDTTDSDEEALGDVLDKIESEDDENARILERTSRMTDEQIAHALAKQQELGLGGDEVMLFDGQDQDEFERGDEFISFSTKLHISNRTRTKRNKRAKDNFPSASAFADALDEDPYSAFDIMDFDRPSLRPKPKGRKADFPFELEDNEWEEQLKLAWSNDRSKKATRKREREEMRQAGLLGSKANEGRADLHIKYANSGMDAIQIKAEIRTFLVEESETLALGSMSADMRASVHRLAKALTLKSHSQGAGDNRHPILTKTPFTPYYSVENTWEIDALMAQRRYFAPSGGWGSRKTLKSTPGSAKIRRGGGGALAGASYMDGEVVGAAAPEIGADNRGRKLLEKMGWTSGTGIGAMGNKGSVEVIKHVVKNTKAGLG